MNFQGSFQPNYSLFGETPKYNIVILFTSFISAVVLLILLSLKVCCIDFSFMNSLDILFHFIKKVLSHGTGFLKMLGKERERARERERETEFSKLRERMRLLLASFSLYFSIV